MEWNSDRIIFEEQHWCKVSACSCQRRQIGEMKLWALLQDFILKLQCWASLVLLLLSTFFHQYLSYQLLFLFPLWSDLLKVSQMSKTCGRLPINPSSMVNLPPVSIGWWGSQRVDEPQPHSSGGNAVEIQRIQCGYMMMVPPKMVTFIKIVLVLAHFLHPHFGFALSDVCNTKPQWPWKLNVSGP